MKTELKLNVITLRSYTFFLAYNNVLTTLICRKEEKMKGNKRKQNLRGFSNEMEIVKISFHFSTF